MKKLTFFLFIGLIMSLFSGCVFQQVDIKTPTQVIGTPTAASVPTKGMNTPVVPTIEVKMPVVLTPAATTVATGSGKMTHQAENDYIWDQTAASSIILRGSSIETTGDGITVEQRKVTITAAGYYVISGKMADGQIIVDTKDKEVVKLSLNGVDLSNSSISPIYIASAEKVVLFLADGTKNTVTDGKTYQFYQEGVDEPNAAIFSKSDLTITGGGALTVQGNFNDGIASKDGLILHSGTLVVNAVDDGIRGKDYLVIQSGSITIQAQGDGLKADHAEDAERGYILIEGGTIQVTSARDSITAATDVIIKAGNITLNSGGGSNNRKDTNVSAKGIKALRKVSIEGGSFSINSADDGIHANENILIDRGVFTIATGDDGLHADASIIINQGEIRITKSYEGIESAVITINGGNISIVSSDDGINIAGGRDASGMNPGMRPGGRANPGAGPGQDTFTQSGKYILYLHGGYILVEATGDGVDANGAIEMTGGVLVVHGPEAQRNSAIDYDSSFKITGGFLVGAGSAGMAQAPGATSSQPALMIFFNSTLPANTLVHIRNSSGKEIFTFAPKKEYQSLAVSTPDLLKGETYEIYTGGKHTGKLVDGLYLQGSYSGGTKFMSFTISNMATTVGTSPSRRRP